MYVQVGEPQFRIFMMTKPQIICNEKNLLNIWKYADCNTLKIKNFNLYNYPIYFKHPSTPSRNYRFYSKSGKVIVPCTFVFVVVLFGIL